MSSRRLFNLRFDSTSVAGSACWQLPFVIPSEQAYYWTVEWQEAERRALADIEAGRTVTFDSDDPEDVVRWLRKDDEQ